MVCHYSHNTRLICYILKALKTLRTTQNRSNECTSISIIAKNRWRHINIIIYNVLQTWSSANAHACAFRKASMNLFIIWASHLYTYWVTAWQGILWGMNNCSIRCPKWLFIQDQLLRSFKTCSSLKFMWKTIKYVYRSYFLRFPFHVSVLRWLIVWVQNTAPIPARQVCSKTGKLCCRVYLQKE